jgi:predicted  nucleic acid-binding Zn-ribbon protein
VNDQLKLLVDLQKLDSRILSDSRTINAMPGRMSAIEAPLRQREAALEETRKACSDLEKKKKTKEAEVVENNDRIEKLKGRTKEIRDNKAYQAHLKEIENNEKRTFDIETEVLDIMSLLEEEAKKVKAAEAVVAEEKKKADAGKKVVDAEVEAARGELDGLKSLRARVAATVDKNLYEEYMDLLSVGNGLALAKAESEVCEGCNMNIMPQLFVKIRTNADIIHCPQCRRILYYPGPSEPEAFAPVKDDDPDLEAGEDAGPEPSNPEGT